MKLQDYKHVHCIGIGGIGISALARYCHVHGARVTGSDSGPWPVTPALQKEGIIVHSDYNVAHIEEGTTLVIYTIATKENNPELLAVKKSGITCMSYPEALGVLTQEYTTIAVCGTHGKTTTTAMLASMFKAVGKNPTVIVGSLLSDGGTNFIQGDSEYLIVEACEYKRSFLNLHPTHIVVTNIDADHLDYYKDLNDIKSAFQEFTDKLPENGSLITHANVELVTNAKKINADYIDASSIELTVLGEHNKRNAQLALALSDTLGFDQVDARKGLLAFRGTWRRLEYKGIWHDIAMYDDYGHHPTEIQATLQALREKYPHEKYNLIAVFQPHLYSRTKLLLDDFATSFSDADKICIMPIYAAREQDDETVSSHDLVEKTTNAIYMETFEEIKKYVLGKPHYHTVLITIGAGDVSMFHDSLENVIL
jgi:UDP-N-acetylmuramate--alanine ligase